MSLDARTRWLLVAALCLPVVAAMVAIVGLDWSPVSDWALIELRVRDVGSGDTPLLGPFSRFGWNHPGPLLFWTLAVPYRLFGSASEALLLGAGAVNLAAVAGIGWAAWRRAGAPLLAWTALLLSLFLFGQGAFALVDPWNPAVVILPFMLLGLLTWSLSEGDHRLVPLAVLTGSWIVQSHVGFTPVVGVFAMWGLGWLIARHRSPTVWRWLAIGVGVGVLLWLPPLVEQVTEQPGNLEQIARHFAGGENDAALADPAWADQVGLGPATEVYARHLTPVGVWLGADEPTDVFTGELLGTSAWQALPLALALVAATAVAWRRRRRDAVLLAGQTGLALGVGLLATARIDGYAFPYLFGWLEALVWFVWLSIGWSVYRCLPPPSAASVRRFGVPALSAVALGLTLVTSIRAVDVDAPLPNESEAVTEMTDAVTESVDGQTVLLSPRGTCLSEAAYGVALQLERAGAEVVVRDDLVSRFGEQRRWSSTDADVEATVSCRDAVAESRAEAAERPDLEVVAEWDPTPPDLAAREDELDAALVEAIEELDRPDLLEHIDNQLILFSGIDAGIDPELLGDYSELTRNRNQRILVVMGPPPSE